MSNEMCHTLRKQILRVHFWNYPNLTGQRLNIQLELYVLIRHCDALYSQSVNMLNKCLFPKLSLVFLLSRILPHFVHAASLQPRSLPLLRGARVLESGHSVMKDEKLKNTDMQE